MTKIHKLRSITEEVKDDKPTKQQKVASIFILDSKGNLKPEYRKDYKIPMGPGLIDTLLD